MLRHTRRDFFWLMTVLSALLLTGCPPGAFFGRYIILNNTGSTITNLTISAGNGLDETWNETVPGQGWVYSKPFPGGPKSLIVSWRDDTGNHQQSFSFAKKTGYRSKADLIIELNPSSSLTWRVIEPPTEGGETKDWALLIPLYFFYCLLVALFVGVPLALAVVISYGLFKITWSGLTATVQGLHGNNTVFQFSLREIFLLTTAVALALGWFVHIFAIKR